MKKVSLLTIILIFYMVCIAEGSFTFDFEGTANNPLTSGSLPTDIRNYMSELYPGTVTVGGMRVSTDSTTTNNTQFVRLMAASESEGDMEILFSQPITSAQFDLAVFDDGRDGLFRHRFHNHT